MISPTAVPARDLLRGPPTRKECIMKWFGGSAARKWPCRVAVTRAVKRGRRPRLPPVVTTGNRHPAVKSHPRYVRRDRPERENRRPVPAFHHYHQFARGSKRLTQLKVEDQTVRLWEFSDLRPQCKREIVGSTPRLRTRLGCYDGAALRGGEVAPKFWRSRRKRRLRFGREPLGRIGS